MKKLKKNSLYLSFLSICSISLVWGEDQLKQCPINSLKENNHANFANQEQLPIEIEADNVAILYPQKAEYIGDVKVKQGNRYLQSEKINIIQKSEKQKLDRIAELPSPFHYQDSLININAQKGIYSFTNQNGQSEKAIYHFVNGVGHGKADKIKMDNKVIVVSNGDYTTCLDTDDSWRISGSSIIQDPNKQVAKIKNAVFRIKNIPIFYFPYLEYPLGSQRRSGILYPKFSFSKIDGLSYAQPIYWNISPEMDLTLTPNYMSQRGLLVATEYRYLTKLGTGFIANEFIQNDKLLEDPKYSSLENIPKTRKLWAWQHSASFDKYFIDIDYTKVSDPYYLSQINSNYGSITDGYLAQKFKLGYKGAHADFAMSAESYQIFDDNNNNIPYKTLPRIQFNYYNNKIDNGWVDFKVFAETVKFRNANLQYPSAIRSHVEPSFNFPFTNYYGKLNIGTKLYATYYQQNKGKQQSTAMNNVSRLIPEFKLDFSTKIKTLFINDYSQTFEPRIVYVYRKYVDQSLIGVKNYNNDTIGYDAGLLTQDYYSLFNGRMFSGLDRIESANQYTLGFTSRILNPSQEEKFNFSIAQIFYIKPSKIEENFNKSNNSKKSSIGIESNLYIKDNYKLHGSYVYNPRIKKTSFANASIEYGTNSNNMIQLNYRFIDKNFIQNNLFNYSNYENNLSQIGAVISKQISDKYSLVGKYYYDLATKKSAYQYIGVQYDNCCWSMQIGYSQNFIRKYGANNVAKDKRVSFALELKGFDTKRINPIDKMLLKDPLPYVNKF